MGLTAPPLFYVLLAPIIGPLTDSHHVLVAGLAARGVNALFGALVPVAVMWGVRQAFPGMNRLAVTSGLVSATPPWLHGVSGAIYNDALATLLGTLVIGLTCRILRRGSPRHEWVWLAVACAAAAATRLATVAVIAVSLVCLVVNGLASDQGRDRWGRWTAPVSAILTTVLVVATSGWFYLRNLRLTGSVTGGHPEWSSQHLNRTTTSVTELALRPDTWEKLLGYFQTNQSGYAVPFIGLVLLPLILSLVGLVTSWLWIRPSGVSVVIVALLATLTMAVITMQLEYSAGGGGLVPRYTLPVLMPTAAAIAWGLTYSQSLSRALVPAWTTGVGAVLVQWTAAVVPADPTQFPTFPTATRLGMGLCLVLMALTAVGVMRMDDQEVRPPSSRPGSMHRSGRVSVSADSS